MSSSQAIMWMIVCCVVFAMFLLFGKSLRFVTRSAARALIGAVSMAVCNTLLAPLGVVVGINALTLFVVAVLGAPGFVTLYITSLVL